MRYTVIGPGKSTNLVWLDNTTSELFYNAISLYDSGDREGAANQYSMFDLYMSRARDVRIRLGK